MVQEIVWVAGGIVLLVGVVGSLTRSKRQVPIDGDPLSPRGRRGGSDLAFMGAALASFCVVYFLRAWGSWDWTVPLMVLSGFAAARLSDFVGEDGPTGWLPWVWVVLAGGALAW